MTSLPIPFSPMMAMIIVIDMAMAGVTMVRIGAMAIPAIRPARAKPTHMAIAINRGLRVYG